MKPIKKLLVANRGEIACRIFRTCKELGIKTVAVYSLADAKAVHPKAADEAVLIGPAESNKSYLLIDAVVKAAKVSGADAVHPGYGFLSENSAFACALKNAGITFVGPTPEVIDQMGDKIAAKTLAQTCKVPLVPGLTFKNGKAVASEVKKFAASVGYPVITKAAAGGGGRGMRKISADSEIEAALEGAARESLAFFSSDALFIEKLVEQARHIEVQILGDTHGNVCVVFDRDCTLQRNHQKVIEEAPAHSIKPEVRAQMHAAARLLAETSKYTGAGTVEFLLDRSNNFYFLEVNSRLQVEHPVSEAITGVDLVALQIRIAQGENLAQEFKRIEQAGAKGAAIELRLCSEIPEEKFIASTGRILEWDQPEGLSKGTLRIDTGFTAGSVVSHYYDSLLAKIIVHAETRELAIAAAREALARMAIAGVRTNAGFLQKLLSREEFIQMSHHTRSIDEYISTGFLGRSKEEDLYLASLALIYKCELTAATQNGPWDTPTFWRQAGKSVLAKNSRVNGTVVSFSITHDDTSYLLEGQALRITPQGFDEQGWLSLERAGIVDQIKLLSGEWLCTKTGSFQVKEELIALKHSTEDAKAHSNEIRSPLPGKIVEVKVSKDATVAAGETIVVIESMKMEHIIRAPLAGKVGAIMVQGGDVVEANSVLATMKYE